MSSTLMTHRFALLEKRRGFPEHFIGFETFKIPKVKQQNSPIKNSKSLEAVYR